MSYSYSPLSPEGDNIRLLRLLPNRDEAAPLHCELCSYSLQRPGIRTHLYEALSYVWGDKHKTLPICVNGDQFRVTENLHAALSHLRDYSLERVIWVDAICINQDDLGERKQQVQLMAKIYSKAHRVIVWLGVNAEGALEQIRLAAGEESIEGSDEEINQQAILSLLQGPWFQRIWVLQEIAAARHIVVMSGSTEIDGYAFCLGVKSRKLSYSTSELQSIPSIAYLMEQAGIRSKSIPDSPGRFSLEISQLPVLIDMFHTRQASEVHDKVYALLAMSSDDLGLEPDYTLSWEALFRQLVQRILGKALVETSDYSQRAVIKSKGCILGQVSLVRGSGGQDVVITSKNADWHSGNKEWTLQASAKSIQEGDVVCLLQGALKPTIIRQYRDYSAIVVIAVTPLNGSERLPLPEHFPRNFLLVWDLEQPLGELQGQEYESLIQTNDCTSEDLNAELEGRLEKPTRLWDVALILGDLGEYEMATERLQEAIKGYLVAMREEHPHELEIQYGLTPLSWAAGNGHNAVVKVLLAKDTIGPDLENIPSGWTPMLWAAKAGHEAVVKLLLGTGKVNVNSGDSDRRTPLSWAAAGGHRAVTKLLLETGKVKVDSRDRTGDTPLLMAAKGGHEAVVRLLLETGKVNVNSKDQDGETPLSWAAAGGHETVVRLLLETGKAKVDSRNKYGETPLPMAAKGGHEAAVKLLLETGKANADSKDNIRETPYSRAARLGHGVVVKQLLEAGNIGVDFKDSGHLTPLLMAAARGHEAVVKLLLDTGKANVDSKDYSGYTPLWMAASEGHETAAKLLLETGKAKVNPKSHRDGTPLSIAAARGHEAVVRLLLETGKAKVDSRNKDSKTPLLMAAKGGHEASVKLLLETGKANVHSGDGGGRTPLSMAAARGDEAVVKLLETAAAAGGQQKR